MPESSNLYPLGNPTRKDRNVVGGKGKDQSLLLGRGWDGVRGGRKNPKGWKRHFVRNELCRKLIKRLANTMEERYKSYNDRLNILTRELRKAQQSAVEKDKELHLLKKKLEKKKVRK